MAGSVTALNMPEAHGSCIERIGHFTGDRRGQVLTTMTARTTSEIVWPSPALSGCIFCMIVRDTRGVVLDRSQRFNFFPASPLCCVSLIFAGDLHLISRPDEMEHPWTAELLPRFMFSGAQLGPLVSWNSGETYAITVGFYPDAFAESPVRPATQAMKQRWNCSASRATKMSPSWS